jgi:ElaB/YqjD/DUF883 family membrane-anchored ribosome-binding protein
MAQGNPYTNDATSAVHDIRDKASEQLDRAASRVEGAARTVYSRSGEVSDNVQEVAGNLKSAVDTSIRDQPMATLAVAAVLGFVLGAIWKS